MNTNPSQFAGQASGQFFGNASYPFFPGAPGFQGGYNPYLQGAAGGYPAPFNPAAAI